MFFQTWSLTSICKCSFLSTPVPFLQDQDAVKAMLLAASKILGFSYGDILLCTMGFITIIHHHLGENMFGTLSKHRKNRANPRMRGVPPQMLELVAGLGEVWSAQTLAVSRIFWHWEALNKVGAQKPVRSRVVITPLKRGWRIPGKPMCKILVGVITPFIASRDLFCKGILWCFLTWHYSHHIPWVYVSSLDAADSYLDSTCLLCRHPICPCQSTMIGVSESNQLRNLNSMTEGEPGSQGY